MEARGRRRGEVSIAIYIFIFLLSLYLLTASLRIDSGDGEAMYRVAHSLISGAGFAIPVSPRTEDTFGPQGEVEPLEQFQGGDGYGAWGVEGGYYARYGFGWSAAAIPFVALGRLAAGNFPFFTEGFLTRAAVMLLNPMLTAATAAWLYLLARKEYSVAISVALALLYGLGTIAWYYAKSGFSEPLVGFLFLAAVAALESSHPFLAGAALAGALVTRQTSGLLILAAVIWAAWRWRKESRKGFLISSLKLLLPIAAGQLLIFGYNLLRFGDPLSYGYVGISWDSPFFPGLYGLLLSPGKGLFIFCPVLILGILGFFMGEGRSRAALIELATLLFLLPHAVFSHWSGGGGWGPRLLLPIIPLMVLAAGAALSKMRRNTAGRVAIVLLVAATIVIQMLGVSVNWGRHLQRLLNDSADPMEYTQRSLYSWKDSPITGQIQSLGEVISLLRDPLSQDRLWEMIDPTAADPAKDWQTIAVGYLSFNLPDLWFIYFWFLGASWAYILITGLILMASALYSGMLIRRAVGGQALG